jgi:hypothetical protein
MADAYVSFLGVSGSASDDVWAVDASQNVMRWNGSTWRAEDYHGYPFTGGAWISDYDDAWFAGADGQLYREDRGTWTRFTTGLDAVLHAIAGTSTSNVWAVGDAGAITHWDGTQWSSGTASLTSNALWSLWTDASDDGWIAGDSGVLLHLSP